jgi:hypothetical protein
LVQVREAYQAKGWVLNNVQNIEQCKNDGYLQMINEQQGEGCHMWGHLSVSSRADSKQWPQLPAPPSSAVQQCGGA